MCFASRHRTLAGRPAISQFSLACRVWKSNAARSSQAAWNPGPIFATGTSGSLCGYPPTPRGDRQVTGTVLTFTNVTAFRASIDQVIYERECTKAILNTVADPLVVLSADQRIQSGNRAFYTMFLELASLRTKLKAMLAGSQCVPAH